MIFIHRFKGTFQSKETVNSLLRADRLLVMKVALQEKSRVLEKKIIWEEFEESATIWLFIKSLQYP